MKSGKLRQLISGARVRLVNLLKAILEEQESKGHLTDSRGIRLFGKAEAIVKACAFDHSFPHKSADNLDCDYCAGWGRCREFWDNYVVTLPQGRKEAEGYLPALQRTLRRVKKPAGSTM